MCHLGELDVFRLDELVECPLGVFRLDESVECLLGVFHLGESVECLLGVSVECLDVCHSACSVGPLVGPLVDSLVDSLAGCSVGFEQDVGESGLAEPAGRAVACRLAELVGRVVACRLGHDFGLLLRFASAFRPSKPVVSFLPASYSICWLSESFRLSPCLSVSVNPTIQKAEI